MPLLYRALAAASLLTAVGVGTPAAQSGAEAQDRPATPLATAPPEQPVSPLDRPARLKVEDVPLYAALTDLQSRSGVSLVYSPSKLPGRFLVSCDCADLTVREAIARLLEETGMRFVVIDPHVLIEPNDEARERRLREGSPPPAYASATSIRREVIVPARALHLQGTIAGRVSDAATGQPISGANVRLDGTRRGTLAGTDGRYTLIEIPVGTHTLIVSMVGYAPQRRHVELVEGQTLTADFALSVAATRLEEVVVTATGEQRRVEVGHVIGSINADVVVPQAPVTRLTDLIGARVAGVQIVSNTGFTGESPRIRIRGLNSFSRGRDPLVYVDGVRVESSTGALESPYGISSGRLNDFNPNDIESVEVVKGPSAATLYGTDAANGVILIRTKRGQAGRPQWHLYWEGGQLRPGASLKQQDSYYSWGTNENTEQMQRCLLVQIAAGVCRQDSLTVFNPLTHHETTPITAGNRSHFGAQLSGGAAQLTYFLSGGFERETGWLRMPASEIERIRDERGASTLPDWQLRPNGLERVALRGSLAASIGEHADVRVTSGLTSSRTHIPGVAVFNAGHWGPGYRDTNDGWHAVFGRPGENFAIKSAEELTRYTGGLSANWRPLGWLSTRATVGTDLASTYFDGLQRPGEGPVAGRDGRRTNRRLNVVRHSVDLGATATAELSAHVGSRTSIGAQYDRQARVATIANATGLPPGSETVTGAASMMAAEGHPESVVAGVFIEQMLRVNDRIYLTAGMRADGAGSFGRSFKTALYPKASASWLLSEESFFRRTPGLENLRIRLAYGQSGVQPGSTDALDIISRFTSTVDGTGESAARRTALGNPDLRPERQREIEGGLDVELLSGRLNVEATYYNRLSTDALINVPVAASLGFLSRWENLGSVRNWGYEVAVALQLLQHSTLSWETTLNGSVNHNRLEGLGVAGVTSLGFDSFRHVEGYPIFGRWARPILAYDDANGNGIIEPNEVQIGDTLEYIGPSHPPRQLTASTALSLLEDRLRLSSQFDYRGGHRGNNIAAVNHCRAIRSCRAVNDLATPLKEQAQAVALTDHGTLAGYMEDASFVRWRELSVTYQLPGMLERALGVTNLAVSLSGRNIRLWKGNDQGPDPEVNSSPGNQDVEGIQGNPVAPQTRYWLVRMDVRF